MPPKAVPPPPRPDPVTLDQVYATLTSKTSTMEEKAYHLVALNTVAFHPTVKLFLSEDASVPDNNNSDEAQVLHRLRRERVVTAIAFFLAQRNNAVAQECRWETVSLLGELCRLENNTKGSNNAADSLEGRLNEYARKNLEFLAQLPWFIPAVEALMGSEATAEVKQSLGQSVDGADSATADGSSSNGTKESKGTSRSDLQARLRQQREDAAMEGEAATGMASTDEDVVIALQDIYRALPAVIPAEGGKKEYAWSAKNTTQAHDLMFLDASTSMMHLIPTVSRCKSLACAQCFRAAAADESFLRCSSCKAVYYCSAACQKQHWAVHRTPCLAYKERCNVILEEYYAVNATSSKKKKRDLQKGEVAILEVPLEPSLFFETRRYVYDHRDDSFSHVDFNDYFMKYTVKGS